MNKRQFFGSRNKSKVEQLLTPEVGVPHIELSLVRELGPNAITKFRKGPCVAWQFSDPLRGQTSDYVEDPMSDRNTYCCANGGTCPAAILNHTREIRWYSRFIRPIAFCIITSMLAMSVSHLCDKYSASTSFRTIRSDIVNLRSYLTTLSMEVKTVMEARDELRSKLNEVGHTIPKLSEVILNLRNELSEDKKGIGIQTRSRPKGLSPDSVREIVRDELQTYDADKTGRTDYALESSGGKILSTRDTVTYVAGAPKLTLFGITLCEKKNIPQAVIQSGVLPGECWTFKGSSGNIVIKLLGRVHISSVSLEHIPASISPTGETNSAPKEFSLWGLESVDDKSPFFFGVYAYNNAGPPIQHFDIEHKPHKPFEIIELKIQSNSGNREYTCIYRVRVHGMLAR